MKHLLNTTAFARMAAAAVLAASVLSASAAQAYDRSVYIYNDGWNRIYSVHISHIHSPVWQNDLLGSYMIRAGSGTYVSPRNHQGYCRFDVRITYDTGKIVRLWDVDLCEVTEIVADEWGAQAFYA